jgi:hypothetical protein
MQLRNWLVRIAMPVALMASAICAGWKWESFPH